MECIPVVNGGGVGVSGECVAVDISNLSPLHCHPNSGLQGHPGGELHPAATCLAFGSSICDDHRVVKQVGLKQLADGQPDRNTQQGQAGILKRVKQACSKGQAGSEGLRHTNTRTQDLLAAETDRQGDRQTGNTDRQSDRQDTNRSKQKGRQVKPQTVRQANTGSSTSKCR